MDWERVDVHIRKRMEELISRGERPQIICWIRSYFKDDEKAKCSKCGITVSIRPYMKKLAEQYGLAIVCISCGDEGEIKQTLLVEARELYRETGNLGVATAT